MKRIKPQKRPSVGYSRIWRVVDGAVRDALQNHPDYLSQKGARFSACRQSIVKRVTGAILSFAEESEKGRTDRRSAG
jgi:hypothetical protein